MSVKIFTMTHKKFDEPQNSIYIPLHVGRMMSDDFGYLGDDTGESISNLNNFYGELTGIYWVWKNIHDTDIIGVCHYRRFFLNHNRTLMEQQEYEDILKEYDIIVSNKVKADKPYQAYYAEAHNEKDLLTVGQVINEKYPEYTPFFESALSGNSYYYGNLFVTSQALFHSYSEWLFDILFETEKRIDVSSYNLYNQRVFGFLSEQLLKVWIDKNKWKAYEGIIGITAEKAETVEFKRVMAHLVQKGSIQEARHLFYEYMKLRPDIRLELSDIKGEIPIIEQLLYIAEQEQLRGISSLSEYSADLNKWITHFYKVREFLLHISNNKISQTEIDYILDTKTSWVMCKIILLNASEMITDREKAIENLYNIYYHANKLEDCKGLTEN